MLAWNYIPQRRYGEAPGPHATQRILIWKWGLCGRNQVTSTYSLSSARPQTKGVPHTPWVHSVDRYPCRCWYHVSASQSDRDEETQTGGFIETCPLTFWSLEAGGQAVNRVHSVTGRGIENRLQIPVFARGWLSPCSRAPLSTFPLSTRTGHTGPGPTPTTSLT